MAAVAWDAAPTASAAAAVAQAAVEAVGEAGFRGGDPSQPDRRRRQVGGNRAFRAVKAQHASDRSALENLAARLTDFASSSVFLVLHVIWFLIWIPWNTGRFGLRPFDPYPFGFLTMVVSLEAIFLSLFVLMTQNRESAIAEVREEVTLAVNLRVEEEVTKVLQLVAGLYARLGQKVADDPELASMLQPLDSDAIERDLTEQLKSLDHGPRERDLAGVWSE
jgi:uncharacterized membrane protein